MFVLYGPCKLLISPLGKTAYCNLIGQTFIAIINNSLILTVISVPSMKPKPFLGFSFSMYFSDILLRYGKSNQNHVVYD